MKNTMKWMVLSVTALCVTHASSYANNQKVYCQPLGSGYSLFRESDNKDIGYSYFSDLNECNQASALANQVSQNIVCSPYINSSSDYHGYSAYRISTGDDLGAGIFGIFEECQSAISQARNGKVCLIYTVDIVPFYAPYDIETGQDLGNEMYESIEECQQTY